MLGNNTGVSLILHHKRVASSVLVQQKILHDAICRSHDIIPRSNLETSLPPQQLFMTVLCRYMSTVAHKLKVLRCQIARHTHSYAFFGIGWECIKGELKVAGRAQVRKQYSGGLVADYIYHRPLL